MESLYELWGKRNPEWEERYQDSVISVFSDYGKGVNQYQDVRGKIYGAGYEVFILAFFIGLYSNNTLAGPSLTGVQASRALVVLNILACVNTCLPPWWLVPMLII